MANIAPGDPGFEMHDLLESSDFMRRVPNHRHPNRDQEVLGQIIEKLAESPEAILQRLVELAVEFCGADSSGISLEEPDGKGGFQFRWVAVAGSFAKYLNGTTPRNYSPCGTCLDHDQPQYYRVAKPYYDFLGVVADPILDGMLIPWESERMRGTIWAVSHKSDLAFDVTDYETLKRLADFVSVAMRHPVSKQLPPQLHRIE